MIVYELVFRLPALLLVYFLFTRMAREFMQSLTELQSLPSAILETGCYAGINHMAPLSASLFTFSVSESLPAAFLDPNIFQFHHVRASVSGKHWEIKTTFDVSHDTLDY